jgi:4-carboxymuconolactone decarboxylase
MDERRAQTKGTIDPSGEAMYVEVLKKPVFDKDHTAPLVGVRAFTINHLFANVWNRSNKEVTGQTISLRERRLITIALLAAQGRSDQLTDHVFGARESGLAEAELLEVMIHVAHYAGWAAGSGGQSIVQNVFKESK